MENTPTLRIVLCSPSDVQAERALVQPTIDLIEQFLRIARTPIKLELSRWEDACPGMHVRGPQGLIDELLRIENSDLFIGIFWKRFGTPVEDADSGTEHEVRCAVRAWKANKKPQVMIYFRNPQLRSGSPAEDEQSQKVQAFRTDLCSTEKALVCDYQSIEAFSDNLRSHLWTFVQSALSSKQETYLSRFRFSAGTNVISVRREGNTELVGDIYLTCACENDVPPVSPVSATLVLYTTNPITSPVTPEGVSEAILFEAGRPGPTLLIHGALTGINEVTFRGIRLDDIHPGQTRLFQITNLRCDASTQRWSKEAVPIHVFLALIGAPVEHGTPTVGTIRKGLDFEVWNADISEVLPEGGFTINPATNLVESRIATLRFVEGFPGSFKARTPSYPHVSYQVEGQEGYVFTGESGYLCSVLPTSEKEIKFGGLADHGSYLAARLHVQHAIRPANIRLFVSVCELRQFGRARTRLVEGASKLVAGDVQLIGEIEVRELLLCDGQFRVVWEVLEPSLMCTISALDFAVFASIEAQPTSDSSLAGSIIVSGGFAPASSTGYSAGMPVPMFGMPHTPVRAILTFCKSS